MENLKTIIVGLSVLVLLGVTIIGCGGKSDEEKLAELNEQMNKAETLEEIAAISEKIEKLSEKIRSNAKTTKVAFGKPITYWEKDSNGAKISQFQITFRDPMVSSWHPVTALADDSAPIGKKYFGLDVELKNLGPRVDRTGGHAEVKVNNGYIYELRYVAKKDCGDIGSIDPGKTKIALFFTKIPENTYPVEVFGVLGSNWYIDGYPIALKFSLKLTQFK
jgi:hypothetical protein